MEQYLVRILGEIVWYFKFNGFFGEQFVMRTMYLSCYPYVLRFYTSFCGFCENGWNDYFVVYLTLDWHWILHSSKFGGGMLEFFNFVHTEVTNVSYLRCNWLEVSSYIVLFKYPSYKQSNSFLISFYEVSYGKDDICKDDVCSSSENLCSLEVNFNMFVHRVQSCSVVGKQGDLPVRFLHQLFIYFYINFLDFSSHNGHLV